MRMLLFHAVCSFSQPERLKRRREKEDPLLQLFSCMLCQCAVRSVILKCLGFVVSLLFSCVVLEMCCNLTAMGSIFGQAVLHNPSNDLQHQVQIWNSFSSTCVNSKAGGGRDKKKERNQTSGNNSNV